MTLFHTPTAFLILGLLYFILPTITWFVLAGHRSLAVKLWCGGGILMGVGVLLIALRGHVPAWATFPLANLLVFAYLMMRIQSLRLDLAVVPWRWEWMAAAALLFVLVLESIRLELKNLGLMVIYNHSIYAALVYYLSTLAWRLGCHKQSHSALWIAWSYRLMTGVALLNVIAFSIGWAAPLPDILDSNPARFVMVILGLPTMVITHIAYIGFILERTHRKTIKMENDLRASEARFRSYFELPLTGRAITSPSMVWLETNATLCDMLGYNETELTQMTWIELTHPDDLTTDLAQFNRVMAGEIDGYTVEKRFIHKDGHSVQTHLAVHCLRQPDQSVEYFVALILDISDRRRAEDALKSSEERLRLITDIAPVFLAEIDKELCYRFVNRRYAELFGLPPEVFYNKRVSSIISEQAFAHAQPYMLKALDGQLVEFETELDEKNSGEHKFVAARYAPRHDDTGQVIGFVAAISNITERKLAEEEIKQLAFYDPLTQLPNRRLLLDRLQQAIVNSDRDETHGALLFIDLDNFKTLNDTLGHDKGDLLLQQAASRIVACVRESDTVARFGGDEFVVILTTLDRDIKAATAQTEKIGFKIVGNLNQIYSTAGYDHYCSASIGIALFDGHGSSIDDLLKMADIAMYKAKAAGRNTLCFFDHPHKPPPS